MKKLVSLVVLLLTIGLISAMTMNVDAAANAIVGEGGEDSGGASSYEVSIPTGNYIDVNSEAFLQTGAVAIEWEYDYNQIYTHPLEPVYPYDPYAADYIHTYLPYITSDNVANRYYKTQIIAYNPELYDEIAFMLEYYSDQLYAEAEEYEDQMNKSIFEAFGYLCQVRGAISTNLYDLIANQDMQALANLLAEAVIHQEIGMHFNQESKAVKSLIRTFMSKTSHHYIDGVLNFEDIKADALQFLSTRLTDYISDTAKAIVINILYSAIKNANPVFATILRVFTAIRNALIAEENASYRYAIVEYMGDVIKLFSTEYNNWGKNVRVDYVVDQSNSIDPNDASSPSRLKQALESKVYKLVFSYTEVDGFYQYPFNDVVDTEVDTYNQYYEPITITRRFYAPKGKLSYLNQNELLSDLESAIYNEFNGKPTQVYAPDFEPSRSFIGSTERVHDIPENLEINQYFTTHRFGGTPYLYTTPTTIYHTDDTIGFRVKYQTNSTYESTHIFALNTNNEIVSSGVSDNEVLYVSGLERSTVYKFLVAVSYFNTITHKKTLFPLYTLTEQTTSYDYDRPDADMTVSSKTTSSFTINPNATNLNGWKYSNVTANVYVRQSGRVVKTLQNVSLTSFVISGLQATTYYQIYLEFIYDNIDGYSSAHQVSYLYVSTNAPSGGGGGTGGGFYFEDQ